MIKRRSVALHQVSRFVEALTMGEIADRIFTAECKRRGLRPQECLGAPLLWLSLPIQAPSTDAMN